MRKSIHQHRRGTTAEWKEFDVVLKDGELAIEECVNGMRVLKLGDGIHKYSELPSFTDNIIVKNLFIEHDNKFFKLSINANNQLNITDVSSTLPDSLA